MPRTQQGLADAGRGGNEILLNLRGRNADECGQLHNAPSQMELTCVNCEALRGWYQETRRGCACAAVESSFPLCLSVRLPAPPPRTGSIQMNSTDFCSVGWISMAHASGSWTLETV